MKKKKGGDRPLKNSASGAPAKQNLMLATQRRQALRAHYFAKYRVC